MSFNVKKLFTRILAIILGMIAVFTGGNVDNIQLEIKNEVTTKTEVIQVEVLNGTGKKITADYGFSFEKNEDGKWVKIDFSDDYKIKETAVIIRNLQTVIFTINVVEAFGKTLDEGEYRITKDGFESYSNNSIVFTVKSA